MSDNECMGCFWWECWACDGEQDEVCDEYLGVKDNRYEKYYNEYMVDIAKACQPVYEKWKKVKNS